MMVQRPGELEIDREITGIPLLRPPPHFASL
jgi:hypothetical protein